MKAPAASQHLCEHEGRKVFRLEPDFLISSGSEKWVLDAKWKLIDISNKKDGYDLQQSDFYQLFAYGHKYLGDQAAGELALLYPKTAAFKEALPYFEFSKQLKLWVLPVDLETGRIVEIERMGLPLKDSGTLH